MTKRIHNRTHTPYHHSTGLRASSKSSRWRHYDDPPRPFGIVGQELDAVGRELRAAMAQAERLPGDRASAGIAIRLAWRVLMHYGFRDFNAIRKVPTESWPEEINPRYHADVALALETVGWHQFGLQPYDIDRTARIFDRCLELTPHNLRALERFAIVANTIQPQHIGGLSKFPKKQRETCLGYKLQCKRKIDDILIEAFGITEAHLLGQAEQSVSSLLKDSRDNDRKFIFKILGHLSQINLAVGDFFNNGTQLSLGTGAACCQLELLRLPRNLSDLLPLLYSRCTENARVEFAGEETDLVSHILGVMAELFELKWRIFKNRGAQQRAGDIKEFLKFWHAPYSLGTTGETKSLAHSGS